MGKRQLKYYFQRERREFVTKDRQENQGTVNKRRRYQSVGIALVLVLLILPTFYLFILNKGNRAVELGCNIDFLRMTTTVSTTAIKTTWQEVFSSGDDVAGLNTVHTQVV